MNRLIYLVRHGEVHNPRHVVYADLDGFDLSERGTLQAESAGRWLAERGVALVVSSPLSRAVQTAEALAAATGGPLLVDEGLTEWKLSRRWAGVVWEALPEHFPGELEAYLDHPESLPFAPEQLREVAARFVAVVNRHAGPTPVAFVSHQDPVQAARFALCGRDWADFAAGKPGHASIICLEEEGASWREAGYWEPEQGEPFPAQTRP